MSPMGGDLHSSTANGRFRIKQPFINECPTARLTLAADDQRVIVMTFSLRQELIGSDRPQALLDKLVITAVSALAHKHWSAPYLAGRNRDQWKLPEDLCPMRPLP